MPLIYDNYPPTAEDVRYDPVFVHRVNNSFGDHSVDEMIMFNVGYRDASTFAGDIARGEHNHIDLAEVRSGLSKAAHVLIEAARSQYERGVEHFIISSILKVTD